MADFTPIALRRTRRGTAAGTAVKRQGTMASQELPPPPPKTPRRTSKRPAAGGRLSEPAGLSSSGLTPMVRRTFLDDADRRRRQQRQRRASTPGRLFGGKGVGGRPAAPAPSCQARHVLHQTADGRVERRIRRSHLRDLLNRLEREKKEGAWAARTQIRMLSAEIERRDREICELRRVTVGPDVDADVEERISDLERQVDGLRGQLARGGPETARVRESGGYDDDGSDCYYNWATPLDDARDDASSADHDYDDDDDDDDDAMVVTAAAAEDDHFGDASMADFLTSTPSRAARSFPTPPATSPPLPMAPETPCSRRRAYPSPPSHTSGVQVCIPDPDAKQQRHLEEELSSLQLQVGKLTTTLDSYKNLGARLQEQLAAVEPLSALGRSASTSDILQGKIAALLQSTAESTTAVAQLTASIARLGFPGADAAEMMTALAAGFRAARLELEYLTPGEITLPLTSHGAEVLDLLLVRLRSLATKSEEDDGCIDEYHALEQSLRKQLDARVSVMDELRAEVGRAEARVGELEVANERLRGAVDSYVRDLAELEALVQRMEAAAADKDADAAGLEEKLGDALRHAARLREELGDVQDSTTRHVVSLNRRHGKALASRDARVLELRGEVDRVTLLLRGAHEAICGLRVENGGLRARAEAERVQARRVVHLMRGGLQRVVAMSEAFLRGPDRSAGEEEQRGGGKKEKKKKRGMEEGGQEDGAADDDDDDVDELAASSPPAPREGARQGGEEQDMKTTKRRRRRSRRRFDSGLGLLEEDEVDEVDDGF